MGGGGLVKVHKLGFELGTKYSTRLSVPNKLLHLTAIMINILDKPLSESYMAGKVI